MAFAVGQAPAQLVDEINVVGATRHAMRQALDRLGVAPDVLLLDHLRLPAVNLPQDAFPKADNISLTVAAASVVAKVTRDNLMVEYSQAHPAYGFERNKGYGSAAHYTGISTAGLTEMHRTTWIKTPA